MPTATRTTQAPPQTSGRRPRLAYPWIAMCVVLTGTFMVILDTTIVNVALPAIGRDLHGVGAIQWVVTGYLLAVGVAQLATGWVSDRVGKKVAYTWSLGLFALGSLLAALAPNLPALVLFRVLQGLGGGAMMPVGLAMLYELFPPDRRGTALGIWGIAAMAAPAIGPVAGGWIVTSVSWRWIFAINVPIGVLGLGLALMLLRDVGFREARPLEWRNLLIAALGLTCLLVAFDKAAEWGWTSPRFALLVAVGLVLMALFVRRELRSPSPLLEMRMFAVRTFSVTIGIVWLVTAAQFARLVLMPVELETVHGLTALQTGLILAPAAAGTAVAMPLAGRLTDHIGSRIPVIAGLLMISAALLALGNLSADVSTTRITMYLMLQGAGTGFALMPNTVAAMNALPNRWVSRASAVRSLNRQIAGSMGVAVLVSVVVAQAGALTGAAGAGAGVLQAAYNDAFRVALVGVVAALALGAFLPGRAAARRAQQERAQEYAELDVA